MGSSARKEWGESLIRRKTVRWERTLGPSKVIKLSAVLDGKTSKDIAEVGAWLFDVSAADPDIV